MCRRSRHEIVPKGKGGEGSDGKREDASPGEDVGWDWYKLLALWSEAGFEPAGFWDQTPRTLDAILKGYVQRRQIENDQFMSLAWHMEALSRSGRKFPSLVSLLGRKGNAETRKQSNEEILAAMRTWAAMQNERVLKEEGQGGA